MDRMEKSQFDVGGVLLNQPFKIRRLGHIGINVKNTEKVLAFYRDLMGFRVSDPLDFGTFHPRAEELKKIGDTRMFFTSHNTDHHSFVLLDKDIYAAMAGDRPVVDGVTINQLTWQVGSLLEVNRAIDWFTEIGIHFNRTGRDMPGSNWMIYPDDPEGHRNELYYGMEQIGWIGRSKPRAMYDRGFRERPDLPQMSEFEEVRQALARGVDLLAGTKQEETLPETYEVDGILMARPFKVVRHGPVRLFVHDLDRMTAFYEDIMGFSRTEEITWQGHTCRFLRCNTEHHSLALYPTALRAKLGLNPDTTIMSIGMQVATYRQLRAAIDFLGDKGCRIVELPAGLTPGIDYAAYVEDPSGHLVELYFQMEQVGWDGRPRPANLRRPTPRKDWPEKLPAESDTYRGEPFLGPWA
jgi:catechol 2,3-dioxygenase-like lactoylglutathione lyase family enzyme